MPTTPPDSYLSYFTPGQMSHETLEFIFVKRHKLANRLLNRIANSVVTEAKQHTLLLGPRGMGKSYMVALMYHRVKAREDLDKKTAVAWLAEEEWGVGNLRDFYLVILRALEQEYPKSDLTAKLAHLRGLPLREIEDAAAQAIRDFVGERTLLLLVENLEEIFRGLGSQGQWAFRSFLSEKPFVTILATTPSLFAGIQKQSEAFYGFFQETYLDELTATEATELLEKVAERRGDAELVKFLKTPVAVERVQAVNDLAGGHPRIYLLFAHLLTRENLDELVTPFLQLLDELTPYYQSRMHSLAPQQRKIIEYLCDCSSAIQVKIIAQDNLLTPQATAAHLIELEKLGYVRKTAVGRESYYELREPLLRMVIELKRSHNTEPIRLIVSFLRRWYSRSDRLEWLSYVTETTPLTRQYLSQALNLEIAVLDSPDMSRAEILTRELKGYLKSNDYIRALKCSGEIIERKGVSVDYIDWMNYTVCYLNAMLSGYEDEGMSEILTKYAENGLNLDNEVDYVGGLLCVIALDISMLILCIEYLRKFINISDVYLDFKSSGVETLYKVRLDNIIKMINGLLVESSNYKNIIRLIDMYIKISTHHRQMGLTKALVLLDCGMYEDFIKTLRPVIGMFNDSLFDLFTRAYISCFMRRFELSDEPLVSMIISLYAEANLLGELAQGITSNIRELCNEDFSLKQAREWTVSWQEAARDNTELATAVRLLTAATAWKIEPDERKLLLLPLEERRILEKLLP